MDNQDWLHLTSVPPVYEGLSSFTNQSIQASNVAQKTVNSDGTGEQSALNTSLGHLKNLFQLPIMFSPDDYHFSRRPTIRPIPKMGPLPLDLIIAILQEIKASRPIFLCSYVISDPSLVERLCRSVYFPVEPISSGHLAAMYGIINALLKEFMILRNLLCQRFDLRAHAAQCERNFNATIESYDVLAVPSFENIFALTMGFTKAQDEAKPFLCYTLISTAVSHCQMLGYHREVTYRNDRTGNSENARRLFWTAYTFEKHISLLFGHASSMLNFDIDARYPALSTDPAVRPWDESFIMGIKLADMQGQIYDKLYSTAALRTPFSERAQYVQHLTTAMDQWRTELQKIDSSQVNNRQIFDITRYSWDIMYYSTFTSLLRAPTTSEAEEAEVSSQCFQVARLALESHLRCFSKYQTSGFLSDADYANWVLLFSSFTPFIVIFLHAIAATSFDDIQLLEEVTKSLQKVRQVSRSSERLYQICSTFTRIAKEFVEARKSCVGVYNQQDDSLQIVHGDGECRSSVFDHDSFQGFLEADMANQSHYLEAFDILNSWTTGVSTGMNLFGGS